MLSKLSRWQRREDSYFQLIPLDNITSGLVGGSAKSGDPDLILGCVGLGSRFAQSIRWVHFPVRAPLTGASIYMHLIQ